MKEKDRVCVVSDKTFEKEVLKSTLPVLVDFGATWCGLCKTCDLMTEEIALQYQGRLKVCKIDVDTSKKPNEYKLRGVPAFLGFKAGIIKGELLGLVPKDQLVSLVEELLK